MEMNMHVVVDNTMEHFYIHDKTSTLSIKLKITYDIIN